MQNFRGQTRCILVGVQMANQLQVNLVYQATPEIAAPKTGPYSSYIFW